MVEVTISNSGTDRPTRRLARLYLAAPGGFVMGTGLVDDQVEVLAGLLAAGRRPGAAQPPDGGSPTGSKTLAPGSGTTAETLTRPLRVSS